MGEMREKVALRLSQIILFLWTYLYSDFRPLDLSISLWLLWLCLWALASGGTSRRNNGHHLSCIDPPVAIFIFIPSCKRRIRHHALPKGCAKWRWSRSCQWYLDNSAIVSLFDWGPLWIGSSAVCLLYWTRPVESKSPGLLLHGWCHLVCVLRPCVM